MTDARRTASSTANAPNGVNGVVSLPLLNGKVHKAGAEKTKRQVLGENQGPRAPPLHARRGWRSGGARHHGSTERPHGRMRERGQQSPHNAGQCGPRYGPTSLSAGSRPSKKKARGLRSAGSCNEPTPAAMTATQCGQGSTSSAARRHTRQRPACWRRRRVGTPFNQTCTTAQRIAAGRQAKRLCASRAQTRRRRGNGALGSPSAHRAKRVRRSECARSGGLGSRSWR